MKKMKDMSLQEAKVSFSMWDAKHPRNEDFDMSGLAFSQCMEITQVTDREAIATMIFDIYNYGFVAGYKQLEAELQEREFYTNRIIETVEGIENLEWLKKIYSFTKVFAEDKKGKA